ncbi:hypothetical protein L228DRAFT_75817 [Xylona heveae TC161]|uniref:Uncharacterized protein n=1 Tax=Xylona heveae (strain CBS 132557 / TC161) TaxID=1328760 RepID=A0A165IUB5_XYLHT|nr:hypothetical protein L228DRAFT_75817 [Xylona heveae TC161]KZF25401.1 hypothetical protein L228DRAFT_75817 [Xylona heveae TC161]
METNSGREIHSLYIDNWGPISAAACPLISTSLLQLNIGTPSELEDERSKPAIDERRWLSRRHSAPEQALLQALKKKMGTRKRGAAHRACLLVDSRLHPQGSKHQGQAEEENEEHGSVRSHGLRPNSHQTMLQGTTQAMQFWATPRGNAFQRSQKKQHWRHFSY